MLLRKDTLIKIGVGIAIVLIVWCLVGRGKCNCHKDQPIIVTAAPLPQTLQGYDTIPTYLAPVGEGYAEYEAEDYQDWDEEEEEYADGPVEYSRPSFKSDLLS
jgi:hypothetical protein